MSGLPMRESGKILDFSCKNIHFNAVCEQFLVKIITRGLGLTPQVKFVYLAGG